MLFRSKSNCAATTQFDFAGQIQDEKHAVVGNVRDNIQIKLNPAPGAAAAVPATPAVTVGPATPVAAKPAVTTASAPATRTMAAASRRGLLRGITEFLSFLGEANTRRNRRVRENTTRI